MLPTDLDNAFAHDLLEGRYNLLSGSGISLDSTNGRGEPLRSAKQLQHDLCEMTGANGQTS